MPAAKQRLDARFDDAKTPARPPPRFVARARAAEERVLERAKRARAIRGHGARRLATLDEDALAHARRGRIGIVLQAFHLLPTMTALENVATPMELAGERDAQSRAKAELEAVGLGHRLDHYPQQLSGGEQQRVAIARAIAPRPDLIFADEPTGNLDAATGHEIVELLFNRRAETGATLLVITHDPELAEHCERVLQLGDGRIASDTAA